MKNNFSSYRFPIEEYREIGKKLAQEKLSIEKEKEKWQKTRIQLSPEIQELLDQEFKQTFEKLQEFFYHIGPFEDAELIFEELHRLTAQGASAATLDHYELGGFNVAGVVKELPGLASEKELNLAIRIVRLSLIADADVAKQKAYVGNGGAPSLYWLCEFLASNIGPQWPGLKNELQYEACFRIFRIILAASPEAAKKEDYNGDFRVMLRIHPGLQAIQKEVYLRLIHTCLVKQDPNYHHNLFSGFTNLIKTNSMEWLPMVFPYRDKELEAYIDLLCGTLKELNDAGKILNGFKATKEGRKFFNQYFSVQQHWLLSHIIEFHPEAVFGLVRGHEQEMLEPFLKNYKTEIQELRDKRGNTLLHAAALSGNSPGKIISRLIQAGLSPAVLNNEGESADDIVVRKGGKKF